MVSKNTTAFYSAKDPGRPYSWYWAGRAIKDVMMGGREQTSFQEFMESWGELAVNKFIQLIKSKNLDVAPLKNESVMSERVQKSLGGGQSQASADHPYIFRGNFLNDLTHDVSTERGNYYANIFASGTHEGSGLSYSRLIEILSQGITINVDAESAQNMRRWLAYHFPSLFERKKGGGGGGITIEIPARPIVNDQVIDEIKNTVYTALEATFMAKFKVLDKQLDKALNRSMVRMSVRTAKKFEQRVMEEAL